MLDHPEPIVALTASQLAVLLRVAVTYALRSFVRGELKHEEFEGAMRDMIEELIDGKAEMS